MIPWTVWPTCASEMSTLSHPARAHEEGHVAVEAGGSWDGVKQGKSSIRLGPGETGGFTLLRGQLMRSLD